MGQIGSSALAQWWRSPDDASMTATVQGTGDTLDPTDDSRDHPRTRVQPTEMLRVQLGRALLLQLRSGPELAALELSLVDQADVAEAIGVLADATAETCSHLARRAIYPISLDHVVERLHAVGARERDVSVDFLHRAVLANGGVSLEVEELIHAYGPGNALYGAFDAATAVIRFAGQRWWRPATDILTDLGFGDHDS